MLFQGQEFGASAPFLYFADHHQELGKLVREGRHRSLWQFRSIATTESRDLLTEPTDRVAFTRCKLDHAERTRNTALLRFHRDLLTLRRDYRALTQPENIDGAVLGAHAFVIRYFSDDGDDLLLLVNLGADLFLSPAPEPLLAPVELGGWSVLWSSESPEYGGAGTPAPDTRAGWILPGFATLLLKSNDNPELDRPRLSEKD
jgi:maltooligosyltrehalose trehalohydrolase